MKISNNNLEYNSSFIVKNFSDALRFKRESYFYKKFEKKKIYIPLVLKISYNKIYFKKYKFKKVTSQKKFLNSLLSFLVIINKVKNYKFYAKDHLISYNLLKKDIKRRLKKLNQVKLQKNHKSKMKKILWYINKLLLEKKNNIRLVKTEKILSQSDIGVHNCAYFKNKIYFYDFEYSGIDHPIKLLCDTYYQPEIKINKNYMLSFIKKFEKKFNYIMPDNFLVFEKLFKVKMMLIILNIFVKSNIRKKIKSKNVIELQTKRLNKAYKYINLPFISS